MRKEIYFISRTETMSEMVQFGIHFSDADIATEIVYIQHTEMSKETVWSSTTEIPTEMLRFSKIQGFCWTEMHGPAGPVRFSNDFSGYELRRFLRRFNEWDTFHFRLCSRSAEIDTELYHFCHRSSACDTVDFPSHFSATELRTESPSFYHHFKADVIFPNPLWFTKTLIYT